MNLKTYLASNNITLKQLSQVLDCTPQYLGLIGKKKLAPSKKLLTRILKATNGEVDILIKPETQKENKCRSCGHLKSES